jgi:hypothetical protein
MSLSPIAIRVPSTLITLNGTSVGRVDVNAMDATSLDTVRAVLRKDGKDHIYYSDPTVCLPLTRAPAADATAVCQPASFYATGDHLTLNTFRKNILMVDGHRATLLAVDDNVQTIGEGAARTLRRLPHISSATTVGIVSAGAVGVALLRGVRSPSSLLVTGAVAAGVAGVAAIGLSLFRAKHPDALPGWLK